MALTVIDSDAELVLWIKRKLGYPSIDVEIDDAAIYDNIADALQYYNRHAADSKYRNALTVTLSAGVDEYTLPDDTINVINIDAQQTLGTGPIKLFTVENTMWNEGMMNFKMGSGLVSWTLAQQYIETMRDIMTPDYFVEFNKFTKTMRITPIPTRDDLVAMVEVYTLWDQNVKSAIFNEIWLKHYALALTKITMGHIWGKFSSIPLPGGGQLDGSALRDQGIEEKKQLEEDSLVFDSEPLGFILQ